MDIAELHRKDIKYHVLKYMEEPRNSGSHSNGNGHLNCLLNLFFLEAFGDYPGFGEDSNYVLFYQERDLTGFFYVEHINECKENDSWLFATVDLETMEIVLKVHGDDEIL